MWNKAGPAVSARDQEATEPRPEIVLDLSRLLSRVLHATPTGIDRVEMAYARELLKAVPATLSFAAVHPIGRYGRLPRGPVMAFLDETERLWNGDGDPKATALRLAALRKLFQLRPRASPRTGPGSGRVYLQASPHHLDRPERVRSILQRERARFVCLVHDLIPIEYPEYARPGGDARHARRMDTLGSFADLLITNSEATRVALLAHFASDARVPEVAVAHLGTHIRRGNRSQPTSDIPYFVCVGTIEPRKNHLLLLQVWRRMAETAVAGECIPKLVLVGRRGWENENVLDLLDRCTLLRDHVIEARRMTDRHVEDLIGGASALLLPSFAEGYGMPVAEALELGVPVICSDLPALKEVGKDVPDYLDPLDGVGWIQAIKDYSAPNSKRRSAQMDRMTGWRGPTWRGHLETVLDAVLRMNSTAPGRF